MSTPLPFQVSPAAGDHILASLNPEPRSEFEPGLFPCLGYEQHSDEGECEEWYDGEHFEVGYHRAESWGPGKVRVTLAGRDFWIAPGVLEGLRGKTLVVKPFEVGFGKNAGATRDLLVAA